MRFSKLPRPTLIAVALLLLAASGVASALLFFRPGGPPDPRYVTDFRSGEPVEVALEQALLELEEALGFRPAIAEELPLQELVLLAVAAHPGFDGSEDRFRCAISDYLVGDWRSGVLRVIVTVTECWESTLEPPDDPVAAFELGSGVVAYVQWFDVRGGEYWYSVLVPAGRGIHVVVKGPEAPEPADMLPMLSDLVRRSR